MLRIRARDCFEDLLDLGSQVINSNDLVKCPLALSQGSKSMIRAYKGTRPRLGERVYVDPSAQVIGDVELGDDASIWMNSVVRGDVNVIRIGARTNIQDNCVVHVQHDDYGTYVDHDVTVGHSVTLHGCRVGAFCLIGIGAIVLNGVELGDESIVAAGALVPEGMHVPPRSLVMGMPARVRRGVTENELEELREYARNYLRYKDEYLAEQGTS